MAPGDEDKIVDYIQIDLGATQAYKSKGYLGLGEILMLDIIATNAANGWQRPIYWCSTVGDEYHVGLTDYVRSTGMTHQIVPTVQEGKAPRTDRAYSNIINKYQWGGADSDSKTPYYDETARRMLFSVRNSVVETASQLVYEGDILASEGKDKAATEKYNQAVKLLDTLLNKSKEKVGAYDISLGLTIGQIYCELGKTLNSNKLKEKGLSILEKLMYRYGPYLQYSRYINQQFISPSLTYESRMTPFQYYRLYDLYTSYGGKPSKGEEIIKKYGFTIDEIKTLYDRFYNADDISSSGGLGGISPQEAAEEVAKYCEIANHLASLTPEEYAASTDEERYIDSMLYVVLEQVESDAETLTLLGSNDNYRNLDRRRAKRLWEAFEKSHPDMAQ